MKPKKPIETLILNVRGQKVILDADLAESASEGQRLIEPIRDGSADMTVANFTTSSGKGGGMGMVVRLARWGILRLTGRRMQTPLSGQRAVRRDVIACVGGFEAGWGAEVALTVNALRLGYRVQEVDTTMTHRVTGRTLAAIRHRTRQFLAVVRVLFRLRGARADCRESEAEKVGAEKVGVQKVGAQSDEVIGSPDRRTGHG